MDNLSIHALPLQDCQPGSTLEAPFMLYSMQMEPPRVVLQLAEFTQNTA